MGKKYPEFTTHTTVTVCGETTHTEDVFIAKSPRHAMRKAVRDLEGWAVVLMAFALHNDSTTPPSRFTCEIEIVDQRERK